MSSPPIGTLGTKLAEVQQRGQVVALVLAVAVGLGLPALILVVVSNARVADTADAIAWTWVAAFICVGAFIAAVAIVAFLPPLLLGRRDRGASAVHAWIGAREVRRVFGTPSAAVNIPTNAEEAAAWLTRTPDEPRLRPLRFEMLVVAGRYGDARALIERLPTTTALDLYRIAEARALVDDQELGETDLGPVRDALARIPPGIDRVEATASLAVLEARRAMPDGDWRAPLLGARPAIPGPDWLILARDFGVPIFRILARRVVLPLAAVIVLIAIATSAFAIWAP